jgi:hypothetical protein
VGRGIAKVANSTNGAKGLRHIRAEVVRKDESQGHLYAVPC